MPTIPAFLDSDFPLPRDWPFTAAMAHEAGITRHRLHVLRREGLLRTPIRGVYLAAEAGDSIPLRAACLRLVVPDDCVICDEHAGWLLGAPMILAPGEHLALRPISMYRPSGHGRLRNKLSDSGERNLRPDDVEVVEGLPVTTPLRTAWDLGRVRNRDRAISALDSMLRLGRFDRAQLEEGVERFRGQRWVTNLRSLAPLADGRAESPGESVLRLRWIELELPTPDLQVEVWGPAGFVARLDLAQEELQEAAEYDGDEWHSSADQRQHDRDRRQAATEFGWHVVPLTRKEVFGPRRLCDEILVNAVRAARTRRSRTIVW